MESIWKTWIYLTTLEWTERVQHNCKFCDQSNFASIVYEVRSKRTHKRTVISLNQDDQIIAVDNIRLAGQFHWLIMPKKHIARDIEGLSEDHLGLCESL